MRILLLLSLLVNCIFIARDWQRQTVVSVPDGDSIQLSDGRRVRLLGIDAPERGNCVADDARSALSDALLHRHVRLKHTVTDDFGRLLAYVIIEDIPAWFSYLRDRFIARVPLNDDPFANRLMVSRGLARFESAQSEYYGTLKAAQEQAKARALGIWSDTCRKTENADCPVKGNIRAGKKTYLVPGCKNYGQTIIDESYGDRWFCTEQEAASAGFSKAAGCTL